MSELSLVLLCFSIVLSSLALPVALIAVIKILALEKSTHRIQFVDPLNPNGVTDEELNEALAQVPLTKPSEFESLMKKANWDVPLVHPEDNVDEASIDSPVSPSNLKSRKKKVKIDASRSEMLPPLFDD